MTAHTLHRSRQAALLCLTLAGRLAMQIVAIGVRGLLFLGAHRALPAAVRLCSPGFLMCSAMFFGAAWLRHALAGRESGEMVLLGAVLAYAVLTIVSFAGRTPEFALCLCISVATDLLAAALSLAGVLDLDGARARTMLLAWPLAAVFVALVQLRLAQRRQPTMPAPWPTNQQAPTRD